MQNFSEKINQVHDEQLGRHLVATMDIEPGETLLEERPLLVVPHWDCGQMKCAQCVQESYVMCKKCQIFPLCMNCQTHDPYECSFFSAGGAGEKIDKNLLVKNYSICAALKMLLLLEQDNNVVDHNNMLQMNIDDYRDTDMWLEHEEQVVKPILESGIATAFHKLQLSAELLHQICINIDTHGFEVISRDGDTLKGIYLIAPQLPHNCVPNTVVTLDEDYNLKIYAAVNIKAGEVLYNSYANPLMGTSQRQHELRMSRRCKQTCTCIRCSDPTELGTHMSSMKCKQCADGYAVCQLTASSASGDWKCLNCGAIIPELEVHKLLADVGEAMVNAEGDLIVYEELLTKYAAEFHPQHFLLLDIKQNIATILRAAIIMHSMQQPAKKLLGRRIQLLEELLPIARAVQPGLSKLYAIAVFDYLLGFLELSEMEFRANDISQELYYHKLERARDMAAEAMEILLYEPTNSPEGYLVQRIIMEQKRIEEELKKFNIK